MPSNAIARRVLQAWKWHGTHVGTHEQQRRHNLLPFLILNSPATGYGQAMDTRVFQGFNRFGLGRRGQEAMPADPAAWLENQLRQPDPAALVAATATGLSALHDDRTEKPKPEDSRTRALYRADSAAQLANAITTRAPFRERLVWFWTNHFTVSARHRECAAVLGAFVEEAIRPHVTGPFQTMLVAVMRHPAMLLYLDNASSVGPASLAGSLGKRGLNENLARESLELHTLTPAAGYSQADVTEYAKILTGWSIDLEATPPGFRFRPRAHQPGEKTLLGQKFPEGKEGGMQALAFLANHPATHRALATALARHFVADDPPEAAIRRIEAALRDTGGNLGAAAHAVIGIEDAWTPGTKIRRPQELVVAAIRALDLPETNRPDLIAVLAGLGQPFGSAPAPNGWPDRATDWAAPEAMLRRIDWGYAVSARAGDQDPEAIADTSLGPLLRTSTRDDMRRAGSRRDALALLLGSPEFQRR